jgi:hypothetical protein
MTLLFFWMKTWHAVYAQTLLSHVCGEAAPRWRPGWLWRAALYQAIVQPLGIVLLPITLPLIIPFGWSYAFFNNATVFAGGAGPDVKTLVGRSLRLAFLWPMQAQFAIFAFKFLGLFVFINLFAALFAVPFLGKALLGIESVVTQSPWAVMNTTALAGICALAWLCLDPFVKALFVLRCFYGESLQTGQDLRAELKGFAGPARAAVAAAVMLALTLGAALPARPADGSRPSGDGAGPSAVPPKELDRAIDEVIQKREYSWRLPREGTAPKTADDPRKKDGWAERFFKGVEAGVKKAFRWVEDFIEWMNRQGARPRTPGLGGFDLRGVIMPLLMVLLVALVGALVWLFVRLWRRRGPPEAAVAEAIATLPDLADDNVGAEELREEGWVRLARDLLNRGELRLALRAYYLASLAALAERNLISLARFKSNRDYERELARRGHALTEVPQVFSENVSVFEHVWYGLHAVTPEMLEEFSGKVERIRTGA